MLSWGDLVNIRKVSRMTRRPSTLTGCDHLIELIPIDSESVSIFCAVKLNTKIKDMKTELRFDSSSHLKTAILFILFISLHHQFYLTGSILEYAMQVLIQSIDVFQNRTNGAVWPYNIQ